MNYLQSTVKDVGCSDEELKKIIEHFDFELPAVYLEFLKLMGRQFGEVPEHLYKDLGWRNFDYAKENALRLIQHSGKPITLMPRDIVFWLDGYGFAFFNVLDGDNPPVYGFAKAQMADEFIKIANSFTIFIDNIRNNNNPLPKIVIHPVLFKELEGGTLTKEEFAKVNKINLELIPDNLIKMIDREYSGLEQRAAQMIAADFLNIKKNYSSTVVQGLESMLILADKNLNKLQSMYLTFAFNPHFNPQSLIDKLDRKNSLEENV